MDLKDLREKGIFDSHRDKRERKRSGIAAGEEISG
jgi:hypothetical protein